MTGSDAGGRLWRYGVLGLASNALCYLAFLGLIWTHVPPVWANGLCYLLGLSISYFGNRRWAFRSTNSHVPDMLRFGGAYAMGLVFSLVCMALLVRVIPPALAQIVTIGATAIAVFAALTLLRFGRPEPA